MATNALTMFTENARPAHLDNYFQESNIETRVTVPSLSYQGKVWTVSMNGEKTKLQKRNADGDMEPVTTMKVIVLDYAKRRGRTYYEGVYDPDKEAAPVCWSDDGIKPHDSVAKKQHPTCQGCPRAIKGSKIVGDKQLTECAQHRMLAVVPAFGLGKFPPLRLKIAITSDFDKQSPAAAAAAQHNWYAFSNYMEFLQSRGVKHSAELITKIKFDNEASYPKLFFAPDRWLETEEVKAVFPLVKSDETVKLLGGTWTPAGVDGVQIADTTAIEAPATEEQAASAASAASAAAATAEEDDDDGEIILEGLDAPPAEAKQEPAQAPATPKATTQAKTPAKAAAAAAEAAPAVEATSDPDLTALLSEWE